MPARILVVDDEPPIVDMLSYNLQQAKYEVIVARDGHEALLKARQEQPDLIILDLMLPRLDGLDHHAHRPRFGGGPGGGLGAGGR